MSIIRFDPFEGFPFLGALSQRSGGAGETSAFSDPRIDWKETPEAHLFKADLPGVKEEVKVEVEDGRVLKISGERRKEQEEKTDTWHRVERSCGNFLRRFRLPENANVEEVKAAMENGVLTVTVPKVEVKKPEMMISVRYSGSTIIGYINLKESDTIGELRKEIRRNSRVYAILRFRIDLVDNKFIILHKSSALPIDTTLTLGECGMKMGEGGNVVLVVCDPEEFELNVTDRDSNQSFTVEIASHERVETLKDKIAQKTQIEPHMQILSFVDAEGKECFLKDGELLVDYKITGPCREKKGRLLVHGLEDSNFDEQIKFIYVGNQAMGSEKTAASTSKMSERAGPSKRQS